MQKLERPETHLQSHHSGCQSALVASPRSAGWQSCTGQWTTAVPPLQPVAGSALQIVEGNSPRSLEASFPPKGKSWRPRPIKPVTCSLSGLLQLPHGISTLLLNLCLIGLPQPSYALQHLVEAGPPIGLLCGDQGRASDEGAGTRVTARQRGIQADSTQHQRWLTAAHSSQDTHLWWEVCAGKERFQAGSEKCIHWPAGPPHCQL